jgi:hypothetical protein
MSEQLSDEEVAELRALLLASARQQWVLAGIRGVATYIAIIAGGYLAFRSLIADFFAWGFK